MSAPRWLHGASVALSAFLLFQVQLCMAKFLLPWFGGSSAVWSTSMAFFQVTLTLGYAWAERVAHLPERRLRTLHLGLVLLAAASMLAQLAWWGHPLLPDAALRPEPHDAPLPALLRALALGVGLPFLLLATNSTLQQALFVRRFPHESPYRLYALANLGSLVGLLGYPFVVERVLPLSAQAWGFLAGFAFFALVVVTLVLGPTPPIAEHHEQSPRPTLSRQLRWVALAACASGLLVATTNVLTNDVAPVPFLWVLPLALYLATFVLTFEADRWYRRVPALTATLLVGVVGLWLELSAEPRERLSYLAVVGVLLATLFVTALACHGELSRSKPGPRHLARFFLLVSLGGSLGSVLVSFGGPLVFKGTWELQSLVVTSWLLLGLSLGRDARAGVGPAEARELRLLGRTLSAFGVGCALLLALATQQVTRAVVAAERDFHGRLQIERRNVGDAPVYLMAQGRVVHGLQFLDEARAQLPTTSFSETSGVGQLLSQPAGGPRTVGVVGLGAGVLAAWCRPADRWTFYELDPAVVRYAQGEGGYFRYLSRCPGAEVVLGDARRSLEVELDSRGPRQFDVLVLDAFSGDSIPAHLVTLEAFALYKAHLRPHGVLAFHLSNQYLELGPVVATLARRSGLSAVLVDDVPVQRPWATPSEWMLMSDDEGALRLPRGTVAPADPLGPVWTDDFSDLVAVLNVRR